MLSCWRFLNFFHVWIKKWDAVCSFFIFYLYLNILLGPFWTSALLSCYWLQHCTWHISVVLLHMWKESPKTPLWFQRKRNCLKRCHLSQCVSVGAEACLPDSWSPVSMLCCGDDLLATFQLADLSISKKCVSHGGSGILVVVTLVGDPGEVWFWQAFFLILETAIMLQKLVPIWKDYLAEQYTSIKLYFYSLLSFGSLFSSRQMFSD